MTHVIDTLRTQSQNVVPVSLVQRYCLLTLTIVKMGWGKDKLLFISTQHLTTKVTS